MEIADDEFGAECVDGLGPVRVPHQGAHGDARLTGIVLATEHHRDPAEEAQRLLALAAQGISPGC